MKRLKQLPGSFWLGVLLGAFLVSVSFAFRYVREEGDRLSRLRQTRQQLADLSAESRRLLEQLSVRVDGQVIPPRDLFARWMDAQTLSLSDDQVMDLPSGYRRHTQRLTLQGLPPAELEPLLEQAENARPAWHLREISLSPQEGGLQGELLLEALDKSPSAL